MPRRDLGTALRQAAEVLREGGVSSPENDAVALAAFVLHVDLPEVRRRALIGEHTIPTDAYFDVVEERATRVPLQHLTGMAPFRGIELDVGPGVFVPRPETESLVDLALAELRRLAAEDGNGRRRVVDLCSGSGAIALSLVLEAGVPLDAHAVEYSPDALVWLRENATRLAPGLHVHEADATRDVPGLAAYLGTVDVVTCNPPYIPADAVPVEPEVADHDPPIALYGGSDDGLRIPLGVSDTARRLLRPGGLLLMEHGAPQGEVLPAALRDRGWADVVDHEDLTGRPRVVTARRP